MTFPQASSERDSRTRWLKISAAFWLLLISAVALINSVGLSRLAEQTMRWSCAWPISNNRPMRTSAGRRRSARPNSPPRGRRWTSG